MQTTRIGEAHLLAYLGGPNPSSSLQLQDFDKTLLALAAMFRFAGACIFRYMRRDVDSICQLIFALREFEIDHVVAAKTLRHALLEAAGSPQFADLRSLPDLPTCSCEWSRLMRPGVWATTKLFTIAAGVVDGRSGAIIGWTICSLPQDNSPFMGASFSEESHAIWQRWGRHAPQNNWIYSADPYHAQESFLSDWYWFQRMRDLATVANGYAATLATVLSKPERACFDYFSKFMVRSIRGSHAIPFVNAGHFSGFLHFHLSVFPQFFELNVSYCGESSLFFSVSQARAPQLDLTFLSVLAHEGVEEANFEGFAPYLPSFIYQLMKQLGCQTVRLLWDTWIASLEDSRLRIGRAIVGHVREDEEPLVQALIGCGFNDHPSVRGKMNGRYLSLKPPLELSYEALQVLKKPLIASEVFAPYSFKRRTVSLDDLSKAWEIVHSVGET